MLGVCVEKKQSCCRCQHDYKKETGGKKKNSSAGGGEGTAMMRLFIRLSGNAAYSN